MFENLNFQNIVGLYTVRLQFFLVIEVIAKNENQKIYKKKWHNYLEVWVKCNKGI